KLVEELQPERSLSFNPLFQVMFAYQNTAEDSLELGSLELSEIKLTRPTAKFDLTMFIWNDEQGSLRGTVEYSTDIFDEATIQRLEDNFITLLRGIIAQPEQRISALPLLSDAERRQVLHDWNATQVDTQAHRCIHQVIAAQAHRTPTAVAVKSDGQTLSYAELNQRANQLAHHLQRQGIGPDQLVGLCVNRSADMLVTMLGILKA